MLISWIISSMTVISGNRAAGIADRPTDIVTWRSTPSSILYRYVRTTAWQVVLARIYLEVWRENQYIQPRAIGYGAVICAIRPIAGTSHIVGSLPCNSRHIALRT